MALVPMLVVDNRVDGAPTDEICAGVAADEAEFGVDDARGLDPDAGPALFECDNRGPETFDAASFREGVDAMDCANGPGNWIDCCCCKGDICDRANEVDEEGVACEDCEAEEKRFK